MSEEIIDFSNISKLYVIYKNYQFEIEEDLNINVLGNASDILKVGAPKVLSYIARKNKETNLEYVKTNLYDLSGNGNIADLYNTTLTNNNDGIIFNGTSSYVEFNLQQDLTFPLTFEFDIRTSTQKTDQIFFTEPKSKTAMGTYENNFIFSINTNASTISIPSDFFDGNIKHIVLEYTSLTDFELYINGTKLSKKNITDSFRSGISTKPRIGSKNTTNYFNGILYDFKIYNRLLGENEVLSTNNNTNIILEYNLKNDTKYDCISNNLKDLVNNNDGNCYNILYNDEKNGLIFNGKSSYVKLNLEQDLSFPITFEFDIQTSTQKTDTLFFIEPKSQTACGTYGNNFICSISKTTKMIPIPSDFFDGKLKHIVLEYSSLSEFELYINGTKLSKINSTNAWGDNIGSESLLGSRVNSNYFKGILYEFNIYNGVLTENEIIKRYNKAKLYYDS